jgi:SulP family sulfate permease
MALMQGIVPVDRGTLARDILAGVTLAAVGIPEVMGYTRIIGTPVVTGLYTILLPMLAFALLGSSRHLVVGADSATAAIAASAVAGLAAANSPSYVALTSLLALMAGGMLLLARVLRLGFLADFLSRTVLIGFLSGVGIQVALGEVPGMLGIAKGGHTVLERTGRVLAGLPDTRLSSVAIAGGVLGLVLACDRLAPRVPGALLAVAGMIVGSALFHWGERGIAVIGVVPSGLPRLGMPQVTWRDGLQLASASFSCFVVILAQSAATSRAYALRDRDRFSEDQDLIGLGAANIAAGLSGTFVVNGSPTKTAMVDAAGGRSQVAQLSSVGMVLIVLLFLMPLLRFLPEAVLSAIVFLIGLRLVDLPGLADIRKKGGREFGLAVLTAGTVVLVGVEQGILLAVVLSLLIHVSHGYRPHTAVILHDPVERWKMVSAETDQMIEPGLVMYWFGSSLYYANAQRFVEDVHRLVEDSPAPVRWFAVDASAVTGIDYTASGELRTLTQVLADRGTVLCLAHVGPGLREDLDAEGLTAIIGEDRIFSTRTRCLEVYRSERRGSRGLHGS